MILELSASNFQAEIQNHDTLVLFYANWCSHCNNMMPEFEKFANEGYDGVNIARIDCALSGNGEICQANAIKGYPTMKFFNHEGSAIDFTPNKRTVESMKEKLNEILHSN